MRYAHDIIRRPIVSEKSMDQLADRKYTFEVDPRANKIEIKKAIEEVFGVKVDKVHTLNVLGKFKRMRIQMGKRPDWKKAIVKLKADSKSIEFFDGLA